MVAALVGCGLALGVGLIVVLFPAATPGPNRLRQWIDGAGLAGVPTSVVAIVLGTVAVIAGAVAAAVIPLPVMAPLGAVAGMGIPVIALSAARDARRVRARSLWPDVIDAIRMALRSGSTLADAVASATTMVPRDWRAAWTELETDLRRGADIEPTLRRLQRTLADPIADRVVESILVAREFGGTELPAVLFELGRSIRREQSMRNEARSRQSWVRHAATLGVVSPWIVLAMLSSRAENREAYATALGTAVIVGAAGATLVAYLVMSALGTLRDERRWLIGALDE